MTRRMNTPALESLGIQSLWVGSIGSLQRFRNHRTIGGFTIVGRAGDFPAFAYRLYTLRSLAMVHESSFFGVYLRGSLSLPARDRPFCLFLSGSMGRCRRSCTRSDVSQVVVLWSVSQTTVQTHITTLFGCLSDSPLSAAKRKGKRVPMLSSRASLAGALGVLTGCSSRFPAHFS